MEAFTKFAPARRCHCARGNGFPLTGGLRGVAPRANTALPGGSGGSPPGKQSLNGRAGRPCGPSRLASGFRAMRGPGCPRRHRAPANRALTAARGGPAGRHAWQPGSARGVPEQHRAPGKQSLNGRAGRPCGPSRPAGGFRAMRGPGCPERHRGPARTALTTDTDDAGRPSGPSRLAGAAAPPPCTPRCLQSPDRRAMRQPFGIITGIAGEVRDLGIDSRPGVALT